MDGPVFAATTIRLEELAVSLAPAARDRAAWQDGLDLLAATAGEKPIAMFGGDFARWRALAVRFGLAAIAVAPWDPAAPEDFVPLWYLEATAARRARRKILLVAREEAVLARAAAIAAKGRISAAEEAAILGYPDCCVAAHHEAALERERQTAARIARDNPGDVARRIRLVATGATPFIAPAPITPSPWTSVNLCCACAADPMSPAQRLDRAYKELASRARYPAQP